MVGCLVTVARFVARCAAKVAAAASARDLTCAARSFAHFASSFNALIRCVAASLPSIAPASCTHITQWFTVYLSAATLPYPCATN